MFKRTTFPTSFGLERGLVVHLGVVIHVADVVVAVQVHVTKFSNSTNGSCLPRGVTCVNLESKSEQLYYSHYNQSKTGVRTHLTSQIKKLEQIYKN
jgi:hypothetical protein